MTKAEKIEEIVKNLEESTDFETMKEMKSILNKTFGEENNQILKPNYFSAKRIAYEEGNLSGFTNAAGNMTIDELTRYMKMCMNHALYYQILIKFPEIEITNGKNKHIINDLYVRAFVRPNGTIRTGIDGIRGKLSIEEVRSQYSHSHLPYNSPNDSVFQPFCTGIGPINQVMMLLNNKYSTANFKMFLYHLKIYVAWESLEGKPHLYIENIGKAYSSDTFYLSESTAVSAANQILHLMKNFSAEELIEFFDYDVLPTRIDLKLNERYEKWASSVIRNWNLESIFPVSSLNVNCLLNTKDKSGRYYAIPKVGSYSDLYDTNKVLLQFKGEDIKLQVKNHEINNTETIKDEEKVPHLLITKHVGEKLTRALSKTAFSNARIRNGCAGSNKPETTRSNPFHV